MKEGKLEYTITEEAMENLLRGPQKNTAISSSKADILKVGIKS